LRMIKSPQAIVFLTTL